MFSDSSAITERRQDAEDGGGGGGGCVLHRRTSAVTTIPVVAALTRVQPTTECVISSVPGPATFSLTDSLLTAKEGKIRGRLEFRNSSDEQQKW